MNKAGRTLESCCPTSAGALWSIRRGKPLMGMLAVQRCTGHGILARLEAVDHGR